MLFARVTLDGKDCVKCSICSENAQLSTACTSTSDSICTCNSGYFGVGTSCNTCSTCTPPQVVVKQCSGVSNSVCAIVTDCKSAAGATSQCIAPQTCFSCSAAQQSSSSTSATVSGSSQTVSGSLGIGTTDQQSSSIAVGFCCDTKTQDCTIKFCSPPRADAGRNTPRASGCFWNMILGFAVLMAAATLDTN
jgi:hypothetical protein